MIVEATYQDREEVFLLMNELERNTLDKEMFNQQYDKCMKNENVYIYLYKDDDIKGCITLYLQNYLHHKKATGEIGELIIKEQYRNLHIGEKLLNYIEEKGRKLDLEEICLSSGMVRKDAHRFYEKHGYIKDHYSFEKKL